ICRSASAPGTAQSAPKATFCPDPRKRETGHSKSTGFVKKLCCANLRRLTPSLVITVSGHDHDRQVGKPLLDFAEQLQAVNAEHVNRRGPRAAWARAHPRANPTPEVA